MDISWRVEHALVQFFTKAATYDEKNTSDIIFQELSIQGMHACMHE